MDNKRQHCFLSRFPERTDNHMWQHLKSFFIHRFHRSLVSDQISCLEQYEPLLRSPDEVEHFVRWSGSGGSETFTDRLRHAFNMHRAGLDPEDEELDFMEFQSTSGFVVHLKDNPACAMEAACIQDHLRDLVIQQGYRIVIADRRIRKKENRQEIVERYVLKLPLERQCGKAAIQGFGTITIEVLSCGTHPCNLKFITNYHTGRQYHPAEPFSELMEHLIS